jgi:hypothetical protein
MNFTLSMTHKSFPGRQMQSVTQPWRLTFSILLLCGQQNPIFGPLFDP